MAGHAAWSSLLSLIAACFLLAWLPQTARAHGGGTPRLTAAPVGPYRLYAWTQPEPWRAGKVHVTVGVTQPVTDTQLATQLMEQPVPDAEVVVTFRSEVDPTQVVTVPGVHQSVLNDVYFDAETTLPTAGPWRVTVEVAAPEGGGQGEFVVDVLPPRTVNWTLVAGAVLVVTAGLVFVGWRARARPTQPLSVATRRGRAKKASA
jgi:hypothetical protein